jgi:hypothetical protein
LNRDLLDLLRSQVADALRDREEGLHRRYDRDNHEVKVGFCQGLHWVLEQMDNLENEDNERRDNF